MLRITMSVSGEGATKYFDAALATSKYYGSERGQWGGKGAELLGLRGADHREPDLRELCSHRNTTHRRDPRSALPHPRFYVQRDV
jgi:hypothetical protein